MSDKSIVRDFNGKREMKEEVSWDATERVAL